MKLSTFQSLAQRWAQTLPGAKSIRVTFSGQNAFTNGQRINLPAFPGGTLLTPHQVNLYNGYIDHERAHIAFSDFQFLRSMKMTEPLRALWNILEDIRIENENIKHYPGSRKYLDLLCHE